MHYKKQRPQRVSRTAFTCKSKFKCRSIRRASRNQRDMYTVTESKRYQQERAAPGHRDYYYLLEKLLKKHKPTIPNSCSPGELACLLKPLLGRLQRPAHLHLPNQCPLQLPYKCQVQKHWPAEDTVNRLPETFKMPIYDILFKHARTIKPKRRKNWVNNTLFCQQAYLCPPWYETKILIPLSWYCHAGKTSPMAYPVPRWMHFSWPCLCYKAKIFLLPSPTESRGSAVVTTFSEVLTSWLH